LVAAFPSERGGSGCSWVETSQAFSSLRACVPLAFFEGGGAGWFGSSGTGVARAGDGGVGALLGPEGAGPAVQPGGLGGRWCFLWLRLGCWSRIGPCVRGCSAWRFSVLVAVGCL
jgi:hypothetical protein